MPSAPATPARSRQQARPQGLTVNRIRFEDVKDALRRGAEDFRAMPTHVVFLGILYPVLGLVLFRLSFNYDVARMVFPLASGFALVGPLAALGLYELSRRRQQGLTTSWTDAARGVARNASIKSIVALGAILCAILLVWLGLANALYVNAFGDRPLGAAELSGLFATADGLTFLLVSNLTGFLMAAVVFAISVVSFPLLLDRDVGLATAVLTSLSAIRANPGPLARWAGIIVLALVIGSIPLLIGLAVVLPILGHATWHLYTKLVPR